MNPEKYERLQRLFLEARELPARQRDGFLERVSRTEPGLRAELDLLLPHDHSRTAESSRLVDALARGEGALVVANFLEGLGSGFSGEFSSGSASAPIGPAPPRRLGRYTLIRRIGHGGMGEVYEAEQDDPKRRVALKVIREGMTSPRSIERFRREAQMLGRLRHRGIARIYDAETSPTGAEPPYFAMELVAGPPLNEFARTHALDVRRRLELIAEICDALSHAHRSGLVHRDLKPGNILVEPLPAPVHRDAPAESDSASARIGGQPKILDFGIARSDDLRTLTGEADVGRLIGTLPYMSPEQALGGEIDARSDIYSIGVIAFELLSGRLPLDLTERPIHEAARIIRDEEPARLGSIDRRLRGDVETIVAKALEKDPERRYPSAAALAADIHRHLNDEPIAAHPPSAAYRILKFTRRNRVLAGGLVATFAALLLGTVVSLLFALKAGIARDAADDSAKQAVAEKREAERQSYRANVLLAERKVAAGEMLSARLLLERCPLEPRNWEWRYLMGCLDASVSATPADESGLAAVAFSADGKRLATAAARVGSVKWWDVETGLLVSDVAHAVDKGRSFDLSDDGGACLSYGADSVLRVWNTDTGKDIASVNGVEKGLVDAAFSLASMRIATQSKDLEFAVWEASSGAKIGAWKRRVGAEYSMAMSADGSLVAFGRPNGKVSVIATAGGEARADLQVPGEPRAVAFRSDGLELAVGCGPFYPSPESAVAFFDLASGEITRQVSVRPGPVKSLVYSPDGKRISVGMSVGSARLMDAVSGDVVAVFCASGGDVTCGAFTADGSLFAVGGTNGIASVVPAEDGADAVTIRGEGGSLRAIAFSPDRSTLATSSFDGAIRLWNTSTCREFAVLRGHTRALNSIAFSPDGEKILSVATDKTCRLWEVATGREIGVLPFSTAPMRCALFTPDGTKVVALKSGKSGSVVIHDLSTGEDRTIPGLGKAWTIDVSPDGSTLAVGGPQRRLRLFDLATLELVGEGAGGGQANVRSVAYSPDGETLAVGFGSGTTETFDARSLARRAHTETYASEVFSVAYSPDGTRIATGNRDGILRVFEADTLEVVAELAGHETYVFAVEFSPDGRLLASASGDGTVRLRSADPLRERHRARRVERGHRAAIEAEVRGLYEELGDVEAVITRLGADTTIGDPAMRRWALEEARRQRP